jgi:nicotinamidase-related amidase
MSSVIDLQSYVGAAASRLLVLTDLQQCNHDELARDPSCDLARSLDNCMAAIRHARSIGLPIAFTRQAESAGTAKKAPSRWIAGFEPNRADMVFERQQPSCYANQLFDDIVSQFGSFAIAGLAAEETCLATSIDASCRGHHVTFLRDASASRRRTEADARAVHGVTTSAIELFADVTATSHWLIATSQRHSRGRRYG